MEKDFEISKMKWIELMRRGKFEKAKKIYWKELFPKIEEKFVRETQERIRNGEIPSYDLLIIPMGLESSYYILLIKGLKPKEVYFLCTREAEANFLDDIIKKTGLSQSQYKKDVVEYEGLDAAEIYEKIKHRLEMFKGKKIAVDLTRGKRVMSAGAAIVGDFFLCDLLYIDEGWIDEIKRGEPGTEKIVLVKNPLHIFGDLEQQYATELFNRYEYVAAHKIFDILCKKVTDPRKFEVKSLISQSYSFWDSLNFGQAFYLLNSAFEKIERYNLTGINKPQIKSNLDALKILKIAHSQKMIDLFKDENFIIHLLVDIYCNAYRRMEQGRIEDAVSRFYRAIELVSQHRLAKRGIDTSSPDYTLLNAEVKEKYNKINEEIYKEEKTLPLQTALKAGHIILFALEDDIWKGKNIQDLKYFIDCIKIRDYSIVAHGINFLDKSIFGKFEKIVKEFILRICEIYNYNFEKLTQQHTDTVHITSP